MNPHGGSAVFLSLVGMAVLMSSQTRAGHAAAPEQRASETSWGYTVVNAFPHDPQAFTQGLIYDKGVLYESTGIAGHSTLRKVALETGQVLQQVSLDPVYFAEGLAMWKGHLVQLTYQHHLGFVYDLASFKKQGTFAYAGEGWGLASDRSRLIMSDGTSNLRFLDPETFQETGRLNVTDRGAIVRDLNELEVVRDEIYANVWHTDRIARISPKTGQVASWIDLQGLLPKMYRLDPEGVLNGIAYDAEHDRLFVTGKFWPKLFEIRLQPRR